MRPLHSYLLWLIVCFGGSIARAEDRQLYASDFSGFSVGEDQLAGHDGWTGSNPGEGVHGIDDEILVGLGKTAYLGSNLPVSGTEIVTLERMIAEGIAPAEEKVQFQVLFGINGSTEGDNDAFGFDFFDGSGELLAAIIFDTSAVDFGVWIDDSVTSTFTGELFTPGLLNILSISIDLKANQWSADLEGEILFTDISFTASTAVRDLGGIGVEWQIADVAAPGDNWMLFKDISLTAIDELPPTIVPDDTFRITSVKIAPAGGIMLEWPAISGIRYQIQHSQDGLLWEADSASEMIAEESASTLTYVAQRPTNTLRLYRVAWLESAQ